jgi:hypothetical protein
MKRRGQIKKTEENMIKKLTTLTLATLAITILLTFGLMGKHSADAKSNLNSSTPPTSPSPSRSAQFPLPQALLGKTYYALAANNVLYSLTLGDPDDGFTNTYNRIGTITNVQGAVLGIDIRPADGKLYALANEGGSLYTINPADASATLVSNLSPAIGSGGSNKIVFDFNPVADAIRLISPNGQNYAVVKDAAGVFNTVVVQTPVFFSNPFDIWFNTPPGLYMGAYTNNLNGAPSTLFYGFEGNGGFFVTIEDRAPSGSSNTGGGRLRTIGSVFDGGFQLLGFNRLNGIDIVTDPQTGANLLVGAVNFRRLIYFDPTQINLQIPPDVAQYIFTNGVNVGFSDGNAFQTIIDLAVTP